jgi:anti-sigma factor RsiW
VNCPECLEKADALLDAGPMPEGERIAIESHLITCAKCRLDYQLSRAIRDLCRARYHYQELPSKTRERVRQTLEREYTSLVGSGR